MRTKEKYVFVPVLFERGGGDQKPGQRVPFAPYLPQNSNGAFCRKRKAKLLKQKL